MNLLNRIKLAWWALRGGVRYAFKQSLLEWRKRNNDLVARQMLATALLLDMQDIILEALLDKKPLSTQYNIQEEKENEIAKTMYQ